MVGSSTDDKIVRHVKEQISQTDKVMVILDSDHHKEHVLKELRIYGPLVTRGNYLIVEDSNLNGHPVHQDHGPGPMEAIEEFLIGNKEFVVDAKREKFRLTFNPRGYLLKVA
jgi:cephalosporin hydroxylase